MTAWHRLPAAARALFGAKGGCTGSQRSYDDVLRVMYELTLRVVNPTYRNRTLANTSGKSAELVGLLVERLNMRRCLDTLRFVHVAGTKGKGTTASYTAALLEAYGLKVGLFTSPHVKDVRERIMVNNEVLPMDTFVHYFFQVVDCFVELAGADKEVTWDLPAPCSFFCLMFLVSLVAFAGESVDVAVVEVGIGGSRDPTNIIIPEASVITALGIDHTEILGDTVEEIALQKAGIMKPGVVCYAAPQGDHPSTRRVLKDYAEGVDSPLVFADDVAVPTDGWPCLSIGGEHAVENSRLALLAARSVMGIPLTQPLDDVERHVLQRTTVMGRSQVLPVGDGSKGTFYLDGAHTYESLRCATRWFVKESTKRTCDSKPRRVLLMYSSRQPERIVEAFRPFVDSFSKAVFVCALDPKGMREIWKNNSDAYTQDKATGLIRCWKTLCGAVPCFSRAAPFVSVEEVVEVVSAASSDDEDTSKPVQVFVTGSFFLVSDIVNLYDSQGS
ncbi:folylpolyglutamate synthase, putative [Trypanosoma equiperdum]|uniref:tetrahydrofolate synthase n=2 Tax=Trypanozoon TaxID=39700 RepID=Q38AL2_TRYB2|nr:folylpolyglutamate-dihydrofolate synthetase, putative [Trypanosoma brucei brucei TREU927]EAN78158.1 folylpolyglutamate-dihydrofolate synthetase, putative [Trypanosoma brucei brucei TREU927]SCU72618.1 folylpolyglutamate synthase, putative [Trypanosoma equiperdum]